MPSLRQPGVATIGCCLDSSAALAIALADESQYEEFYAPPDSLSAGARGEVIRFGPTRPVLEPINNLLPHFVDGEQGMQ